MERSLDELVQTDAQARPLAKGFIFTEGPAADAQGNVYFVDIGSNRIHFCDIDSKMLSTVREESGGADGMFVGADGALWICEIQDKRVSKIDKDGAYSVVLDTYDDEPFSGPNDLWFDGQGGLYFTDSYAGHEMRGKETRLFYRTPRGELSLLADDFYKSNGLHGSPDGRWLYVADYLDDKIYRYPVGQPGQLGERTLFAEVRCDGMTVDEVGNLYLGTGNYGQGVVVVSPEGETLGAIELPEDAHNVCFGGPEFRTLFVTATSGLYTVEMKVRSSINGSPLLAIKDVSGVSDLIEPGATLCQLATGFHIAQGPAATPNGDFYFADIFNDRIYKWEYDAGDYRLILEDTGGGDGLAVMEDGSLLVCELMRRRFCKLTPDGKYEVIADSFEGEPLTGANDVLIDRYGGIYFSDSYTGFDDKATPTYCVYYIAPGSDQLIRIVNDHYKSKGIQISPDEKWIYIADFGGRKVYRYELLAPGVLGSKEVFIDRMCGGMALDENGNIYVSTVMDGAGLCVYNPDGELMGQILVPECTSNVTFAGRDLRTLIITTFESVYTLDLQVRGFRF